MPIVNLIDAGIVQTRLLSSGWDVDRWQRVFTDS